MIKICNFCGKEFKTSHSKRKYCSQECMGKAKRKNIPAQYCLVCGKELVPNFKKGNKIRKYCSQNCYNKAKIKTNELFYYEENYVVVISSYKNQKVNVLLDIEDFEKFKNNRFTISKKPKGTSYYVSVKNNPLHRLIMNCPKGKIIDHINHNGLDNRKQNLRICNYAENSLNRQKSKTNKSGYTGICYRKSRNEWRVHYRKKELGRFKTLEEAIKCRKEAEQKDAENINCIIH